MNFYPNYYVLIASHPVAAFQDKYAAITHAQDLVRRGERESWIWVYDSSGAAINWQRYVA